MKKEVVVFLVTMAVLAALYFLAGEESVSSTSGRGGGRGAQQNTKIGRQGV